MREPRTLIRISDRGSLTKWVSPVEPKLFVSTLPAFLPRSRHGSETKVHHGFPGNAGPATSDRQRRSGSKPRVGATRLPWVDWLESCQPQRGSGPRTAFGRNPVGRDF